MVEVEIDVSTEQALKLTLYWFLLPVQRSGIALTKAICCQCLRQE